MRNFSDFAVPTTLSAPVAAGDAEISVSSTVDYPSYPFLIIVFEGADTPEAATTKEVMRVTGAGATGTWAVERDADGYNGGGQSFTTAASVAHAGTARDFDAAASHLFSIVSGEWIGTPYTVRSSRQIEANWLRMAWIPVSARVEVTAMGIQCTTAGSADGTTHFGLWRPRADGTFELVKDLGTLALSTTGGKQLAVPAFELRPGGYWVGALTDGLYTTPPEVQSLGLDGAVWGGTQGGRLYRTEPGVTESGSLPFADLPSPSHASEPYQIYLKVRLI